MDSRKATAWRLGVWLGFWLLVKAAAALGPWRRAHPETMFWIQVIAVTALAAGMFTGLVIAHLGERKPK
jgi:hypothetical protein